MARDLVVKLPTFHADQVRAYRVYLKYPRFVLRAGRRWGKNIFFQTIAACCAMEGGLVGIFAPDYKTLSETYHELRSWLDPVIATSSRVDGVIRLTGGGRIDAWTLENPRAGRSRQYDTVIFDEAAFNKPSVKEVWEGAVEPTLLDRQGRAIFASNADWMNEDNWFYQISKKCEAARKQVDGADMDFGEFHAPTRNNPTVPKRLEGETDLEHAARRFEAIEKIRKSKHPLQFQKEFEAEFIDNSGVAFFSRDNLLEQGLPVAFPSSCGGVFATIDTATKTGKENDGTAVVYCAVTPAGEGPHRLIILDWDLQQIEGSLLEAWLPEVFKKLEDYALQCRARAGSLGAFIEDKASGMVLLQQAARRGWPATPIDSKLTAMGKSERAINVSGYVFRNMVRLSDLAYNKVTTYKEASRNHLLSQVLGFRVGDKDPKASDDLLDAACYAMAIALGNNEGF